MLKTSMIALTLAASLGGALFASVTPASADDGWYWRHHRHHEWREYDRYHRYDGCRTIVRRYRVWTHFGPEWVVKRIRVCD